MDQPFDDDVGVIPFAANFWVLVRFPSQVVLGEFLQSKLHFFLFEAGCGCPSNTSTLMASPTKISYPDPCGTVRTEIECALDKLLDG